MFQNTKNIKPFEKKVWLSSPTMHGDEQKWVNDAFVKNWITTAGENINEVERIVAERIGVKYAVALSCGTAALHLATKLAGERLYGQAKPNCGTLQGHKVFCSDMTFNATVNSVTYEGGEPVFIDTERDTWNISPAALERAFGLYPDVKLVMFAHLYGVPAKIDEIRAVCTRHGALIVEDAAESLGATYKGKETGCFGGYNAISFNGNKIITGSSGGMFLTNSKEDADKVRKWSTQSREAAPWYQHVEMGYNYRMSNIIAGVIRGQMNYLDEHIAQKRAIYERYKKGFDGLPVSMNPFDAQNSQPNYWLSCLLINKDAMCLQKRTDTEAMFVPEKGKTCPTEILETLAKFNAEGRPIWKPMHMQPIYNGFDYVTADGLLKSSDNKTDVGADIFARGLCLPSDNKMTPEQQDIIIEIVRSCFE
ncbi:MAG: DegT/DnrJ/EryC1/StrS family aminotransferase [Salinivirgaceae bacterium]|nr:DegT/DnrJ/EryC1/StrS family aminotransferase [Salinivirgaceae bacterium]